MVVIALIVGVAIIFIGAHFRTEVRFKGLTEAVKALDKRVALLEASMCDKGGEP